jgi:hyaluronate lyase
MDLCRGREISRFYSQEHDSGQQVTESVMRLARIAPEPLASRFRSMAKHWLVSDTFLHYTEYATVPFGMATSMELVTMANEILQDERIEPRADYIKFQMFAAMDRAVHHRNRFAFGISMFSSRIASYESINGENLKGWYTAHGNTYLYNGDLGQFSDGYWPTVNPYRLPGTTVTTAARENSFGRSKRSSKSWVGGVGLAGIYGAVGMELEDYAAGPDVSPMTAKKSWFLFDEEIVALGSDVHAEQAVGVETIVENRKLNEKGDNRLTVDGAVKPSNPGWSEPLTGARWIHLEGKDGEDADIGYYFPDPDASPALHALRETRTGNWSDISNGEANAQNRSGEVTRHYFTLWFDHGIRPKQGRYAYVLLPGKTSEQVGAYAKNPPIRIVEQSASAHAVYHSGLGIWGVHFWKDETKTAGPVTSCQKAAVMLRESENEMEISVSDPTQLNEGYVELAIAAAAENVIRADEGVEVLQLAPTVRLRANVKHAQGKTFSARLGKKQTRT